MPTAGYISPDWFDQEQEALFGKVWTFAGMAEDLTEPGDYLTVEAGRYPLVLLCGKDGEVRAFHNVCRHRGSKLLEGSGNIEDAEVVVAPSHDLQAGGKAVFGKSGRHRNSRALADATERCRHVERMVSASVVHELE